MSDEIKDVEIEVEPTEEIKSTEPDKGKSGPPEGSKRWNEVYWEAQEGKRAREERDTLKQQLLSNEQLIKEMSSHNQLLTEAVNKIAGSVDDKTQTSQVDAITSKISALREEKRVAREKADFGSEDRIDDEILDLKLQLKEMKSIKEPKKSKSEPGPKKIISDVSDDMSQEENAIYDNWINENIWFNSNPKMRKAAIETEKSIRGNPDFEYATTHEILNMVKTQVENKFKGIDTGGVDLVASGSGSGSSSSGVKVKISSAELEIAKGFGVSPQDLAKQKMLITQARQNKARR